MKAILYSIFAIVATGVAIVLVLSAKIIGFLIGIIFAISIVACIIFFIMYSLFNRDDEKHCNKTKEPEDDNDPHTRVFK